MQSMEAMQRAIDYIESQLAEEIDLEKVAERAYMSLPNLYRGFYSVTGHPLKEYIRRRRVSNAAWHLRHSDYALAHIAAITGFGSDSSLSKIRRVTGLSPGMYRLSEVHYSFEYLRLAEKVRYTEDRDVSERYGDVKVIRLQLMRIVHRVGGTGMAGRVEHETLSHAISHPEDRDPGGTRRRYFGRNTSESAWTDRGLSYGYEIYIAVDEVKGTPDPEPLSDSGALPGGLYAVCSVPASGKAGIVAAWNRLQAEWLPKSAFALGRHAYLEEFIVYGARVVRMKLYLPIERREKPVLIDIRTVPAMRVAAFRAYGREAQTEAEARLTAWSGATGNPKPNVSYRCYIAYHFAAASSEEYWWEAGISTLQPSGNTEGVLDKTIGGGEYACVETKALGSLHGAVEQIHQWLYESGRFEYDDSREWFIEYETGEPQLDENNTAWCYVPVTKTMGWE